MKLGRKIFLMLTAIVVTTMLAIAVYGGSFINFSNFELAKTFEQFGKSSNAIEESEPFSVLLMGVDTGDSHRKETWEGNSDTMLLVTVNPKTKQTTMTSLERDILVDLSDQEGTQEHAKLNAAYANGGTKEALSRIGNLLDIDIDYYMQVNMQGLVDLVDAVGGIKVTNEFDFPISIEKNEPQHTAKVEPGTHHINGEQALVYSRMRYDDPKGDYGRQERQRIVIQKVVEKLLNMGSSVGNYQKILKAISANMKTDISLNSNNLNNLLKYRQAIKNVKTYQLRGSDAEIDGGSYQVADLDGLLKIQNRIKKQLGLSLVTKDSLKTNAVLYEELYGSSSSQSGEGSSQSGSDNVTPYNETAPSYSAPSESYIAPAPSSQAPAPSVPSSGAAPSAPATP